MFTLYIDASSVTNCKSGDDAASAVGIEFSIKDYYAIQVFSVGRKHFYTILLFYICVSDNVSICIFIFKE